MDVMVFVWMVLKGGDGVGEVMMWVGVGDWC